MRKKLVYAVFAVVLVLSLSFALAACNDGNENKSIVYLGDSIAEALIGPSPIAERENYGYYALLGRINNFNYYNHSVSGHKTSGEPTNSDGLLEMVNRTSEGAELFLTHLRQADIIHISILGNNFLQNDLGRMITQIAETGQSSTMNCILEGRTETITVDGKKITYNYSDPYEDIRQIVDRLKELNPTAKIFFQNVYNPVYEGTTLISAEARATLAEITDVNGDFGPAGAKITTTAQLRKIAEIMLNELNGVLTTVKAEPEYADAFEILDAHAEFNEIADADEYTDTANQSDRYSANSKGRALIFGDFTHPSNYGHAVLAELTQKKLIELGYANAQKSLSAFKDIRLSQIDSLYSNVKGFDSVSVKAAINAAAGFREVTETYFAAISGFTPIYG